MILAIPSDGLNLSLFVPIVGFINLILGATALLNLMNRSSAAQTLATPIETDEQIIGGAIQNFSDRGLQIDPNSPIVQEALRRRALQSSKQQAEVALRGPSWTDLLGVFLQK